jgi:UDP-N-acetylmuramyl pentapeptide phosphotransferase/UDP-N-acetylglucosamine-1-phosphate transferase
LWGIFEISNYVSIPLTIFACVGIINAINLIDGVDGYSSGYSIVSCTLFGIMFHKLGNMQMVALAAIVGASLVPFFIHNVFGKKSKMFIGDAGTLSLGIIFSVFVITILSSSINAERFINHNLGLIPFTLAVMCIPVADTLRVMSARILKGKSPFSPDKTHLHHLFIELGFNHISTALIIITINSIVILCWFAAYKCGASIDVQLYLVIAMGVLATFILYPFAKIQIRNNTKLYQAIKKVAQKTHLERKGYWVVLQKIADWQIKDNISKS